MKIGYFINQYPAASHSFIRREILALERQGVSVERIALRYDPDNVVDPEDVEEAKKTRHILQVPLRKLAGSVFKTIIASPVRFLRALQLSVRIGIRSDRGLIRHLFYLAEACILKDWMKTLSIKHVHAHFGTNSAAIAMFCSVLADVTYSFTVHGPEEFDKAEFIGLGEKIRRAKFVVAITSYCRSQLYRQVESQHWQKIHIVHCGLDRKFLEAEVSDQSTAKPDVAVFTCVGRLCEQKGQLLLLDAFRDLIASGQKAKLVLAGDGPMRKVIESRISDLSLQDSVTITGWIDSAEVQNRLKTSTAMVLPSFAEGLPVVLMEALAMGKPVISTYIAGIPELIQNRVSGWLIPAGCRTSLADALREACLSPPGVRKQMGTTGQDIVRLRHNADVEAGKLAALFGGAV